MIKDEDGNEYKEFYEWWASGGKTLKLKVGDRITYLTLSGKRLYAQVMDVTLDTHCLTLNSWTKDSNATINRWAFPSPSSRTGRPIMTGDPQIADKDKEAKFHAHLYDILKEYSISKY